MQVVACVKSVMNYSGKALDILETARILFSKKGFKSVTTREIAKEAKVNEVTIFRLFDSKEKLFEAMLNQIIYRPKIEKYINRDEKDIGRYLLGLGKLIQAAIVNNKDLIKIELMERRVTDTDMGVGRFPGKVQKLMVDYFVANCGYKRNDAEILAVSYMSSVYGLCLSIYILNTFDKKINFDQCLSLIVDKFK